MDCEIREKFNEINNDIERLKSQAIELSIMIFAKEEELKKFDSIKRTCSEAAAQMGILKEALIKEAGFTEEQAFQIILKTCPDGGNK